MTSQSIHDDQIRRMREWAAGAGHHPDTYRKRPVPVTRPAVVVNGSLR